MRRSKEDRYIREINEPVCRRMIFPAEVIGSAVIGAVLIVLAVLAGWGCSIGIYKLMVFMRLY